MTISKWKRALTTLMVAGSAAVLLGCGGGGEEGDTDFVYLPYEEPITQNTPAPVPAATVKYYDLSKTGIYAATNGYTQAFNRREILDQVWSEYPLNELSPERELSISPKSTTVENFLGRRANVANILYVYKTESGAETRRSSKRYIEVGSNTVLGSVSSDGSLSIAGARSGTIPRYVKPGDEGYLGTDLVYSDISKSKLLNKTQVFWEFSEIDGVGVFCYLYINSDSYITFSAAEAAKVPFILNCTLIEANGTPRGYISGLSNSKGKYRYISVY